MGSMRALLQLACVLLAMVGAQSRCPYADLGGSGRETALSTHRMQPTRGLKQAGGALAANVNWNAVKKDLKALFKTEQSSWPADFGHYGPFFIRLAWHCAGSWRAWDGRGGCDGGRIRFDPELSWPDNTNLNKALEMLRPIKNKYGDALSWGDLIILSGNTAIEDMGGPVLGFCAGRIDDVDGTDSLELGPSAEQEAVAPCPKDGKCEYPLGATTLGLIYANPEGPMGKPDPVAAAAQVRDTFKRMGMNDSETVALIGGGHNFGKCHGACPAGPGQCGDGVGLNTYTSGFEGQWVAAPTSWGNWFFVHLLSGNWQLQKSPGGKWQWNDPSGLMMLTTDMALMKDAKYKVISDSFVADWTKLDTAFSHAWYKLTSRDMGPVTRCLGNPAPAQPFQMPLPPPPDYLPDFSAVRADIVNLLYQDLGLPYDTVEGQPYNGALFVTLAWRCASTFRATDYQGGCNGARIRLAPQKNWPINAGMDKVLIALSGVKEAYGSSLTWADLIVLAGQTAAEEAIGYMLPAFCGGRSDATSGSSAEDKLAPRKYGSPIIHVRDNARVMGLTSREAVALSARLRSPVNQQQLGYSGSWSSNPSDLSNAYFRTLLAEDWKPLKGKGNGYFKAAGKDLYMLATDLALIQDKEYLAIVNEYAADNNVFLTEFSSAWAKFMNADRFAGPGKNLCA